ncbi:MAG: hypothetical protein LBV33_02765 [Lachnospiraceae bacterium]|jgi:hypothetical protein|nr:hypothetical protein [Lachnospiraceae bacterium]
MSILSYFIKKNKNHHRYPPLRFTLESHLVQFSCAGLAENEPEAARCLSEFLLELSREKNVFLHTYRLSGLDSLVEESTILSRAESRTAPFNSFYQLTEARLKSPFFITVPFCEAQLFFFDRTVQWEDFIANARVIDPLSWIKNKQMSASFSVIDHGADFRFESDDDCLYTVTTLFKKLSELGWRIN